MSIRKGNNPRKRAAILARSLIKNLAVLGIGGESGCHLINIKTLKSVNVTRPIWNALSEFPHEWQVYMMGLGVDHQSQPYFTAASANPPFACYQEQIMDSLNEQHYKLINGMNQRQVVGAAWLASIQPVDWEPEELIRLLERFDAFSAERDPDTGLLYRQTKEVSHGQIMASSV